MSWMSGVRTRLRLLFARRSADARMDEEFDFHVAMEAERLERERGLPPAEARRQALLSFGGVERHRETMREGRTLARLSGLSLDVKLGARMLVKYPGLTLVGGLAMAFAICVGAGTFEFARQAFAPSVPLRDGDRIVAIQMRDLATGRTESRVVHDFELWRGALGSIEDVSAFRTVERNLVLEDGSAEPLDVAEMSAAGFRIAGVAPLLGRTLVAEDERPGAPLALVIGHGVWQRRFGGDPDVIGRSVRLGVDPARVVGVMPEAYGFPIAHEAWLPLRVSGVAHARREGPGLQVFGKLAPGVSLERAQAELTTLAQATAADFPATHEHLRPQVMGFAKSWMNAALAVPDEVDLSTIATLLRTALNLPVVLFLLVVCGNVGLLVFARAAAREGEIAVRTALGASRRRIMGQLFVEALVLGSIAAVVGVVAAGYALGVVVEIMRVELMDGAALPFWFDPSLSPTTFAYAAVLTVIGAAIAGVLPALKVTRGLGERMRQGTAGGGGFRFGGVWTAVIVAQIAVTVPFPLTVVAAQWNAMLLRSIEPNFADDEYLSVRLELDREPAPVTAAATANADSLHAARLRSAVEELERRIAAEAGVAGVTFAERLPRTYHPYRLIDVDAGGAAPVDPRWPGYRVSSTHVERNYFDVLGVPIRAGRGFLASDVGAEPGVVIVNRSLVRRVFGSRNPIGRRIRYAGFEEGPRSFDATGDPWYEIVGVVDDLAMAYGGDPKVAGFYHPVAPGAETPARLAIHVPGGPAAFGPRLRELAVAVDPGLRLYDTQTIARITDSEIRFVSMWFWLLLVLTAVALLLSLAGLYAVMSFTVAQRTREIGIRVALGAEHRRILGGIFRRPLVQLGIGVLSGGALMLLIVFGSGETMRLRDVGLLLVYLAIMTAVCLLAAVVPARRALGIAPAEALRWE